MLLILILGLILMIEFAAPILSDPRALLSSKGAPNRPFGPLHLFHECETAQKSGVPGVIDRNSRAYFDQIGAICHQMGIGARCALRNALKKIHKGEP